MLAMLVVRSRKHVIWYTRYLRHIVELLPEQQHFGVLAVFSPFIFEGRNRKETDYDINGEYTKRADRQYGVVKATREPNSDIRLLVVADKLQTGYDEPRLSLLFLDKRIRHSNVVQTLGRLSRIAPDKKDVYIYDFENSRDELSAACNTYWGVAMLKKPQSKEMLQRRLSDLAAQFAPLDGLLDGDIKQALQSLLKEDQSRRKLARRPLSDDLLGFKRLCNRLQVDSEGGVTYETICKLHEALMQWRDKEHNIQQLRGLAGTVHVHADVGAPQPLTAISVDGDAPAMIDSVPQSRGRIERELSVSEVIALANMTLGTQPPQQSQRAPQPTAEFGVASAMPAEPADAETTLKFARQVWACGPQERAEALEQLRAAAFPPEDLPPSPTKQSVIHAAAAAAATIQQPQQPPMELKTAVELLRSPQEQERKRAISALCSLLPGELGEHKVATFVELGGVHSLAMLVKMFVETLRLPPGAPSTFFSPPGSPELRGTDPVGVGLAAIAPHVAGALRLLSVIAQPEHGISQRVQNIAAYQGTLQAIVALLSPLDSERVAQISSVWASIQSLAAKALASLCLRNSALQSIYIHPPHLNHIFCAVPNRKSVVERGAVELLLGLLEGELPALREPPNPQQRGQQLSANVCSALAAICYDQGAAARVGVPGSELLSRFLSHRNQATITTSLRALVAVATSDDTARQALSANDSLRSRLQELVAPSLPANTRDAACSLRTLLHEAKALARFQPRIPQQPKRPRQ